MNILIFYMFVLFIITQADFQMALRHDSGRWDAARDGKAWVEIFELYNLDQNGAELLATRSRKHTVEINQNERQPVKKAKVAAKVTLQHTCVLPYALVQSAFLHRYIV